MKSAKLNEAFGYVEDRYLDIADGAPPESAAVSGRRNGKTANLSRTMLLAAAVAALLTVAVFAIGYTIHQRRQAELRQELQIDQSNVTSYVEYDTPETDRGGVTILSALRDGKFQKLYVNISPVEKEEAETLSETIPFHFSVDGENWGIVHPVENGYDEETRTLTVECSIHVRYLEGLDSAELRVARIDREAAESPGSRSLQSWVEENDALIGTARFTPTKQEMRFVSFEPAVFTDAQTGREVTVLALELSPTSIVWHLSYEGAEELYTAHRQDGVFDETSQALVHAEEYVLNHAVLRFSDGSSFAPGGALAGGYADGEVLLFASWEKAVDIRALESVDICGSVLPVP